MADNQAKETSAAKKFGRGAHECHMCGRKQGLVRRYNIYFCRQCFREWASRMGFKKMN
ncbi:MAG: 30S ribosomal protein S14 [Methanomicrobiaceae archaeon]|uniref:Ssu ribosomal protein s29e (S14p) n=1 Tax=hydrocarbon metagenome TaxID=938273 RepID=A0A0W8FHL7_9ZZZZ|nr:30S ribosomal protein S14 [Methanomicrobiaceae archaeon]MDD5418299.1 30S ribosomal protein S14 [Methanomicrobiaceae archaeon]